MRLLYLSASFPYPLPRHKEDPPVEEQDGEQRHVEARSRREDLIADVLRHQTLVVFQSFVPLGVFPSEHWRDRHEERENPQDYNHDSYSLGRALMGIIDIGDGPVSALASSKIAVEMEEKREKERERERERKLLLL
jgi:hypothetical protein